MTLSPSGASLVGRLLARLGLRQGPHLGELDCIRAFLKEAPRQAAEQSEINWGPLRGSFGTGAHLRPGGEQTGSRPTPPRLKNIPPWDLLAARKLLNGKPLYVRGHLLSHGWGGVGLDYNWVILTAASGGDFGANHANTGHRFIVEGPILWAYKKMHGLLGVATISEIFVQVVADYNRTPREGTKELLKIAQAYWKTGLQLKSAQESNRRELTHQEVMDQLAKNPPSPHLHDAMLAVGAESQENWQEIHQRIIQNQRLWQFEDENAPLALRIKYWWIENGTLRGPHEETISIMLPTSLAARFQKYFLIRQQRGAYELQLASA